MDYVIYTFGGGDLLWHVFNGIGRVFASNSEYFTPVGHLALTIGGIWAATRAIFRGNIGIFAMEWFFPSIFIFTLLFAPKATVWLKDEVSMNAPVKVDNIPIGIAMFASLSSQTSYFVSKMLEQHLLPAYEGLSSRKTGIMFGAKAVAKIRDVQIHDPVTLTNTKEFLRQCFMKPYIIGNILGKKAAAQQTNDIIGFIEQNIPNNFGIYYREPSNLGISFKTCRQATPLIKAAIHKELNEGLLTKFAAAIGVQSDQSSMLSQRLKVMTGDTLKYLQREQQDIHEWMKQAMLLNANRESYDDWREKFSLSRIYPNLVSMHAIRGLFQKSFSYLVAGEMAAHMMPILQSVFFALVVSMIFIVFPMGLLPGGYNILKTWILLIIWVSSWPVFFTIIHCLGMISLSSKSGAFGSDYGLNMLSQGSFAEMILYSYATFQMLASSIPMLSWSVIKACAHATANLASQFSPMPVASSLGSNIVDNNLSMDNYSIGNRTISQQNLAPSLDMTDSIINYGSYKIFRTADGRQIINENVDSLLNNFRSSAMLQAGYQNQFVHSQSMLNSLTQKESNLISTGNSMAMEIGQRLTHDEIRSIGLTESEYQALQEVGSSSMATTEYTGSSHSKSSSTSTSAGGGVWGFNTKVLGGDANESNKGQSSNQQQSYNEAVSKIQSAVKEGRFSTTNSDVRSLSENLNANLSEQQSIGQEIAKTKQEMEQLSYSMNYVSQNSITIDRNINELVLNEIIAQNPEIRSKEQAARWAKDHSAEAEKIAFEVAQINNKVPEDLRHNINDANFSTKQDLQEIFNNKSEELKCQNANYINNKAYNKNIEQTFIDNEKVENLDRISDSIKNKTQEIQNEFNNTSNSAVIMTGNKAVEVGKEVLKSSKKFKW
ncbi:conjugal transfer protein TraG N-terminal domain-containing protein [Orientia tsutsugamushi]|uniref:conjugal transfer protein TraG N-terminal domain-containing protein n=1 Tax=Orientia tsutsugamushi TaxID=784 RepID=UPI00123C1C8C|nr:conjugal transfer protein TraG N-terminal domain-containing protein [Orientia tsutsugamushi]QES96711.1 conjugal transfer protein TraG [Orientia tsutsugamushi]